MRAVRHRVDRMLEHSGIVAEREEMADPDLRTTALGRAHQRTSAEARLIVQGYFLCRALSKTVKVALCRLRPCHRSARRIGALAHRQPADIVRQQTGNLTADRLGVAERNQNAAPLSQQFLGVPIRRRTTAFPSPKL